jgi:hypothetical protein
MTTKAITIVDGGNTQRKIKISTETEFTNVLDRLKVSCLLDDKGFEVGGFTTLKEGNTYTLGEATQHRPQPYGKLRCCFCGL